MTSPVETWRRISPAYFEGCWNSIHRPHRQPILDAIASLMPATSLLEIGCNAGPNLRLIHERWPEVRLVGIEVNAAAAIYAGCQGITCVTGDLRYELPRLGAGEFDIILSCYCLAYIEPDEIADVLAHMVRIARVGLVIAEPMAFSGMSVPEAAGIPEWRHDYVASLPMNFKRFNSLRMVEPPVERLNAVLTVRL